MRKLHSDVTEAKENEFRVYIPADRHIVVRLDGRGFSKFTKKFTKPFDRHFSDAMISATKFVSEKFGALVSYTQSDEITVVIEGDKNGHNFAGRTDKLLSLMASTVTVKFYQQLSKHYDIDEAPPTFDARIMAFTDLEDALSAVVNRLIDCRKNSVGMFSHHHFGHKANMNKTTNDKIKMITENGLVWEDIDNHYKYGTLVKKETYTVDVNDSDIPEQYRGNVSTVIRRWYVCGAYGEFSDYIDELNQIFNGNIADV